MFSELIKEIKEKEIVISFSNGKLQYSGPEQYIDEELIIKLKKFRGKLLKHYWPSDCPNMMPINTEGKKIPLSLLHAGPANYTLSEFFGKDQPFYGYFYIGSEGENIKYKSVESFAKEYLNQLQKIIPNGPYILGGFSFGGILAFDMAIQLQKQGFDVPFLILVDCSIPSLIKSVYTTQVFTKISKKIYNFLKNVFYWFYYNGRNFFYEFFNIFKIKLPVNFRKPYILWTYSNLMKVYRPQEIFQGEILLFRMEANTSSNKYLGWDKLCDHVQVVTLRGNHNTMYESKESMNVLKEKINELIQKANGSLKVNLRRNSSSPE